MLYWIPRSSSRSSPYQKFNVQLFSKSCVFKWTFTAVHSPAFLLILTQKTRQKLHHPVGLLKDLPRPSIHTCAYVTISRNHRSRVPVSHICYEFHHLSLSILTWLGLIVTQSTCLGFCPFYPVGVRWASRVSELISDPGRRLLSVKSCSNFTL